MTRAAFLLAAVALLAQAPPPAGSPTALYHAGAQAYIAGETADALAAVDAGLALAPGDPKLTALRDLIAPPDDQTDEQDGGEDQPAEDSEPGDQGPEGDDQQDAPQPPDTGDGQQAERDQTQTGDPGDAQDGEAPAQPEGREAQPMTAAQAQRILDAVGSEEKLLLRELRRAPGQRARSDKDW